VTETLNSQPGWLASRSALLTGFATFAIALLIAGAFVFRPREPRVRTTARAHGSAMERFHVGNLADRATAMADRLLSRHERSPRLNKALERAGIDLRPAEFAVLVSVAAVTASALGWLVGGLWVGLTLPVLAVGAAWFVVHHATARRLAKFGDQLADTLQMLAGSLRAGYSFLQAADAVGRESADPTAEEFRRLLVESRLGRDLSDALGAMHERVGNEDFLWFMQAVAIQREVGGDLAEILDTVAETVRERSRLRRQVSALSAEGRLSAVILFVLPFVVGGFIMLVNPGYLDVLMDSGFGVGLLAFAGGLMAVGGLWLKKLVRITF
jgi:tight adherence protein B